AIAFSAYGLEHGVGKRKEFRCIQTHPVSSIAAEKAQKKFIESGTGIELPIPSLSTTQREQKLPSDDVDITKAPMIKTDKETNKGMPVGKEVPISPEKMNHSPVFSVVLGFTEKKPKGGAKLYGLLGRKMDSQNQVLFFFNECRDDSLSRAKRDVTYLRSQDKELCGRHVLMQRVRGTSKLICGPKEGHISARDKDARKVLSASLARFMFSQITIKHDGTIKVVESSISVGRAMIGHPGTDWLFVP
ncbi:uncharacterized protein Bfra_000877, partial [Botrytis fragariae]